MMAKLPLIIGTIWMMVLGMLISIYKGQPGPYFAGAIILWAIVCAIVKKEDKQ